jgi:hypothetical protein
MYDSHVFPPIIPDPLPDPFPANGELLQLLSVCTKHHRYAVYRKTKYSVLVHPRSRFSPLSPPPHPPSIRPWGYT